MYEISSKLLSTCLSIMTNNVVGSAFFGCLFCIFLFVMIRTLKGKL